MNIGPITNTSYRTNFTGIFNKRPEKPAQRHIISESDAYKEKINAAANAKIKYQYLLGQEMCKTEEGYRAWERAKEFANEYPYTEGFLEGKALNYARQRWETCRIGAINIPQNLAWQNFADAKSAFTIRQDEGLRKYFEENKNDGEICKKARAKVSRTKEGQEAIKSVLETGIELTKARKLARNIFA